MLVQLRRQLQGLQSRIAQIAGQGPASRTTADPPVFVALPSKPVCLSNEQVAYELLLDANFRLKGSGDIDANDKDKVIRAMIDKCIEDAFFKSMVDELCTVPPYYSNVLMLLKEIREDVRALSTGNTEYEQIGHIIDIDLIRDRVQHDALDFGECWVLIGNVVEVVVAVQARICGSDSVLAETRAHETRGRSLPHLARMQIAATREEKAQALVDALESVANSLSTARMDFSANKLRAIAPVIHSDYGTCSIHSMRICCEYATSERLKHFNHGMHPRRLGRLSPCPVCMTLAPLSAEQVSRS